MIGTEAVQKNAGQDAQARQIRQKYIDCSLKSLRPRYIQRKAQENLMEKRMVR